MTSNDFNQKHQSQIRVGFWYLHFQTPLTTFSPKFHLRIPLPPTTDSVLSSQVHTNIIVIIFSISVATNLMYKLWALFKQGTITYFSLQFYKNYYFNPLCKLPPPSIFILALFVKSPQNDRKRIHIYQLY